MTGNEAERVLDDVRAWRGDDGHVLRCSALGEGQFCCLDDEHHAGFVAWLRARLLQDESGSMVIYMMGLVMAVLFMAGMSIDVWRAISAERALGTAIDSAASAGANGIDEVAYRSSGTIQLDPGKAESMAADGLSQQPEYDKIDALDITATPAAVTVRAQRTVGLTLMRMFVRNDIVVKAESSAQPRRGS